jgi:hypothetical protein
LFAIFGFKLNKSFHVVYYTFYQVFSRDKFGTLEPPVECAGYKEAMTIVAEKLYEVYFQAMEQAPIDPASKLTVEGRI